MAAINERTFVTKEEKMSSKKQQAALQAEDTIAAAGPPEDSQPVTVTVWADGDMYDMLTEFAEDYHEETLNTVNVEQVSYDTILSYVENDTDMSALPFDALIVNDIDLKKFFENGDGYTADLSALVNADDFMEYKIANVTVEEQIRAYPVESSPTVMYIRQDVLTENNIELPEPLTWDAFIEIGGMLKEVYPNKYLLPPVSQIATVILRSGGKSFYDENGAETSYGVRPAMELIKRLTEAGLTAPETENYESLIADGNLIAIFGGLYIYDKIDEILTANPESAQNQSWAVTRIPETEMFNHTVYGGGRSILVKENDKTVAAVSFLNYCFGKKENGVNEKVIRAYTGFGILPTVTGYSQYFSDITNHNKFNGENVIGYLIETAENVPPLCYGKGTKELENLYAYYAKFLVSDTIPNVYGNFISDVNTRGYNVNFEYKLVRIAAEKKEDVILYNGDMLTKEDLIVTAYYDDGHSEAVTDYTILLNDGAMTIGNNSRTISFTYGEDTETADITVYAYRKLSAITAEIPPEKKYYISGKNFISDGLTVKAYYNDGTVEVKDNKDVRKPSKIYFNTDKYKQAYEISYAENGITQKTQIELYRTKEKRISGGEISQDMGDSGSGAIDLTTGKMVYRYEDFSCDNGEVPLAISRIYNENFGTDYNVGKGWKLNVHQKVEKFADGNWVYTDKNGDIHVFKSENSASENNSSGAASQMTSETASQTVSETTSETTSQTVSETTSGTTTTSAIKNAETGLTLTENSDKVVLTDKSGNELVFEKSGNVYRLSEMNSRSYLTGDIKSVMTITYDGNGRVSTVKAGADSEVKFEYNANGKLIALYYHYKKMNGDEKVYDKKVEYEYDGENLKKIKRVYRATAAASAETESGETASGTLSAETENSSFGETEFKYETNIFTVYDGFAVRPLKVTEAAETERRRRLKYVLGASVNNVKRVTSFNQGYEAGNDNFRDETTTIQYVGTLPLEEADSGNNSTAENVGTTDGTKTSTLVTTETKICYSVILSDMFVKTVISFDNDKVVSQYVYESNGSEITKETRCVCNGFDYSSLESSYGNTLIAVSDDFDNSETKWMGGSIMETGGIGNGRCYGNYDEATRILTRTIKNFNGENKNVYAEIRVKSNNSAVTVTFTVKENETVKAINSFTTLQLENLWQYIAVPLGVLKNESVIEIKIEGESVTVDKARIIKAPYAYAPTNIQKGESYDNVYDETTGNPTKTFSYNPVSKKLIQTDYVYDNNGNLTEKTVKEAGSTGIIEKEKTENPEPVIIDGQITGYKVVKREYGKDPTKFFREEYEYDTNGRLERVIDRNGAMIGYFYGETTDGVYEESLFFGDPKTPSVSNTVTYIDNADTVKEIRTNLVSNKFEYDDKGRLSKIRYGNDGEHSYLEFGYGGLGNITQVKENGAIIESSTYFDTLLKEKTLANGYKVCYNYDNKGRVVSATESATEDNSEILVVTVAYNGDNTTVTHANGVTYTSEKENSDSVTSRFTATNDGKTLKIEGVPLTDVGEKSQTKYYIDGNLYDTEIVTKDEHGNVNKIEFSGNGARRQLYYYDEMYRRTSKVVTVGNSDTSPFIFGYEYKTYRDAKTNETLQTNLVEKETLRIGSNGAQTERSYEYYKDGKLMLVRKSGELAAGYIYDDYGRLKIEFNYERGKEYSYTYDSNGNILSKKTYKLLNGETFEKEDLYEYGDVNRKDLLTKYNGATITYDEYGNPLAYKGKTFEWKGKNLVKADGLQMEYDYNGLRTKKGNKKYFWYGNRLLAETYIENNVEKTIYYRYDESGVCGMKIGAVDYYFRKNIFGDILAVYNSSKTVLATYTYDTFGNASVTYANVQNNSARLNPFRYRGYYWDDDLELYYLQSRYYDPEIGRFISPDSIEYITPSEIFGLNLYAYCYNDPVNYVDPTGQLPILLIILGVTALIGLGLTIGGVASGNNTLTAIGLTMITIPALISGGMAVVAGIGGATLTGIVGGVTTIAGVGSGLFASAEYQEAFTGNNWMLDAGMSESFYNGLMLSIATVATFGTITSGIAYSFQMRDFLQIGRIRGVNAKHGYFGIRYIDMENKLRSLEIHPPHNNHGVHLQLNTWWLNKKGYIGQFYKGYSRHINIFRFWRGWF